MTQNVSQSYLATPVKTNTLLKNLAKVCATEEEIFPESLEWELSQTHFL